jgi:hypothetical protein
LEKLHAHVFEELAHLAGTASQSGQLKDSFARFGDRVCGLFLERFADQITIRGHFTDWALVVAAPESVQTTFTKSDDITLDGGSTNANNLGGLPASDTGV